MQTLLLFVRNDPVSNLFGGIVGIGLLLIWLVMIVIGGALYFLPTIIAAKRSHPHTAGIVLVNIFLGWTFLGWIGSLIWAVTTPQIVVQNTMYYMPQPQLTPPMKVCRSCNVQVPQGASFCLQCGNPV